MLFYILGHLKLLSISIFLIINPLTLWFLVFINKNKYNQIKWDVIKYIWFLTKNLSNTFSQHEINHYQDVQKLLIKFILLSSLLYFIKINICWIDLLIVNLFYIYVSFYKFHKLWSLCHYPFFKNESWLLPDNSLTIKCFPIIFWQNIIILIIIVYEFLMIKYIFFK